MTAAGPSDKFNSLQVTSPTCRAKVIPSMLVHIAKLHTGESRALWCLKLHVNTSAQTSNLLDIECQDSADCNNLSAATEQSEYDNQYLLISFTPKTHMDFSASPRGILCNLHLKVEKREQRMFHYPETTAPNVTTTQVRPQLQRHHWPMKLKLPLPLSTKKVLQPQWSKNSITTIYFNCIFPHFKIPIRAFQSPSCWGEWN